jgi:predicted Zn-dependent protease with MMP-like domain
MLTIRIKGVPVCDQMIPSSFEALPKQLRHALEHVKLEYQAYDETDHVLYELGITGPVSIICNIDAPLLKNITISSRASSRVS